VRFRHGLIVAVLVPAMAVGLGACGGGASSPGAEIQVYAAASLKNVIAAATDAYEAATPGVTLTVSTDSSTALETKIEQGAPADVFLSADTRNPQKLVDGGYASGPVTDFAGNLLTIIVPAANPAGITSPADLARAGVKIIAAAEGVPVQQYTAQLLANLVSITGLPADFPARYASNVVSREDNASALVAKIGLGEGDAGVAYVTDAKASGKVATIDIPADANVPATYGGVVVKASRNQDAAHAFLVWLAGPEGQAVLSSFGFLPPAS